MSPYRAPANAVAAEHTARAPLRRAFLVVVFFVTLGYISAAPSVAVPTALAALLIGIAALLPMYLWCMGMSAGLPIFPLLAVTFSWTYALPLLSGHPAVAAYTPDDHLFAGMAVSGFLLLATVIWLALSRPRPAPTRVLLLLNARRGLSWLVGAIAFDMLFFVANQGGWVSLPWGVYTLVHAVLLGLSTLAAFVLPFLWGRGELDERMRWTLAITLVVDVVTGLTSLLLIDALAKSALALVGFTLGERRFRLLPLLVVLGALVPLHYGKHPMRDQYWQRKSGEEVTHLTPAQYPAFFAEWIGYSVESLKGGEVTRRSQSFAARASLVQLFLLASEKQREELPTLNGATYAIIPKLLVPRILMPDKPASHAGTYMLNMHYGLQTEEDTVDTTIGWGLFNEAFGNFGLLGIVGLAIALGLLLGWWARWTHDVPPLAARFLLSVLLLALAYQTELSAGVVVASLFQSAVALGGLMLVLGRRAVVSSAHARRSPGREPADDYFEFDEAGDALPSVS